MNNNKNKNNNSNNNNINDEKLMLYIFEEQGLFSEW